MNAVPEIISRQEARALGLNRYFTGKLCKHGHCTDRDTRSGHCRECGRIQSSIHYQLHPRPQNTEKDRMKHRLWRETNREKSRESQRKYRAKEDSKEKRRRYARKHRLQNPDKYASYADKYRHQTAKRRSAKLAKMAVALRALEELGIEV